MTISSGAMHNLSVNLNVEKGALLIEYYLSAGTFSAQLWLWHGRRCDGTLDILPSYLKKHLIYHIFSRYCPVICAAQL